MNDALSPDDVDPGSEFSRRADDPPTGSRRLRRFRRIPMRIVLPNLVTLMALCLGMTSIRFAAEGRFDSAVLAILAAAVLDGLDGRIARALEGATRFGAELDSLDEVRFRSAGDGADAPSRPAPDAPIRRDRPGETESHRPLPRPSGLAIEEKADRASPT